MFSAHIDRHGLVCTGPNEFQYAAFVAASNGLVDGTAIQIPTIGYHTMHESAAVESVDALLSMLKEMSNWTSQAFLAAKSAPIASSSLLAT